MMDKDFSPAPLDDQDLNALFEAAQRDTPELDPEFLMRLQAQAAAAVPAHLRAPNRHGSGCFKGSLGSWRNLAAGRQGRAWPWQGRPGWSSVSAHRMQCWTSPALISKPKASASLPASGLRLNLIGKTPRG